MYVCVCLINTVVQRGCTWQTQGPDRCSCWAGDRNLCHRRRGRWGADRRWGRGQRDESGVAAGKVVGVWEDEVAAIVAARAQLWVAAKSAAGQQLSAVRSQPGACKAKCLCCSKDTCAACAALLVTCGQTNGAQLCSPVYMGCSIHLGCMCYSAQFFYIFYIRHTL